MVNRIKKGWIAGLFVCLLTLPGRGQSVPEVVAVEEDWEMVLREPDPSKASPQILTWMSPTDSLEGEYFGIDMNLVERPDFTSGGFQTKAMRAETIIDNSFSENGDKFSHSGETVRWTQRMQVANGQLSFEVDNGLCQSWGAFGGPSTRVRLATSLSHLNSYDPNRSIGWSGVGYGSNRVDYLRLKTVRLYTSDGNVLTLALNADID